MQSHIQTVKEGDRRDYRAELRELMDRISLLVRNGGDVSVHPDYVRLLTLSGNIEGDPENAALLDDLGVRAFCQRLVILCRVRDDLSDPSGYQSITVLASAGRNQSGRNVWCYFLDVDLGAVEGDDSPSHA